MHREAGFLPLSLLSRMEGAVLAKIFKKTENFFVDVRNDHCNKNSSEKFLQFLAAIFISQMLLPRKIKARVLKCAFIIAVLP